MVFSQSVCQLSQQRHIPCVKARNIYHTVVFYAQQIVRGNRKQPCKVYQTRGRRHGKPLLP